MTLSPIRSLTQLPQNLDGPLVQPTAPEARAAQARATGTAEATAEQRKVAQEFEAIFLRQLLGSLEKGEGIGGSGTGAEVYRSMMVGALADQGAAGGGIGLAELVLQALLDRPGGTNAEAQAPAPSAGSSSPQNVLNRGVGDSLTPSGTATTVGPAEP